MNKHFLNGIMELFESPELPFRMYVDLLKSFTRFKWFKWFGNISGPTYYCVLMYILYYIT